MQKISSPIPDISGQTNKLIEKLIEELDRKSDAIQRVGEDLGLVRKHASIQEREIIDLRLKLSDSDLKTKRLINAFDIDIIPQDELRRRYGLLAGKLETALERLNNANQKVEEMEHVEVQKERLERENTALRQAHMAQQNLVLDLQESVQKAQKFKSVIQKQESVITQLEASLMASKEEMIESLGSFGSLNSLRGKPQDSNLFASTFSVNRAAATPAPDEAMIRKVAQLQDENLALKEKIHVLILKSETPLQSAIDEKSRNAEERSRNADEKSRNADEKSRSARDAEEASLRISQLRQENQELKDKILKVVSQAEIPKRNSTQTRESEDLERRINTLQRENLELKEKIKDLDRQMVKGNEHVIDI